jgi:hypothetical protein
VKGEGEMNVGQNPPGRNSLSNNLPPPQEKIPPLEKIPPGKKNPMEIKLVKTSLS